MYASEGRQHASARRISAEQLGFILRGSDLAVNERFHEVHERFAGIEDIEKHWDDDVDLVCRTSLTDRQGYSHLTKS